MKEQLAEQLLGNLLNWDTATAKDEIAELRYLAAVKYDGYRNFEPGYRFMESLALWLQNFSIDDRPIAYNFVKHRMLYISEIQMDHLVGLLYPQKVFPILLDQARLSAGLPKYQMKKIKTSESFDISRRKTLFFGMSDGARIDAFRRKNALDNEQVCVSFELSGEKIDSLHRELEKWIEQKKYKTEAKFENIFLIDDFSGSGNSILRKTESGDFAGRLSKFITSLLIKEPGLGMFCSDGGPNIFIVTYVATDQAITNLKRNISDWLKQLGNSKLKTCEVLDPVQLLNKDVIVPQQSNTDDEAFEVLLVKYYDDRLEDKHTRTGSRDVIHGYANCSLPLILCHNCPNNSVYLLWGSTLKTEDKSGLHALFPRISRHLEGR